MVDFIRSRVRSFAHAFAGWWYVISTQKNAWIHAIMTTLVIIVSFWLRLAALEWAILFLVIGFVWFAEFLNTALEVIVDLASPVKHPLAKVGKDVGAAAVLIAALVAIIVGLLILGPPLLAKIQQI